MTATLSPALSPTAPSQNGIPAPSPAPAGTTTATPSSTPSPTAPSGDAAYVQDIQNAGITASAPWILSAGQTCADGPLASSSDTDSSVLLPGGILPEHLAAYDTITQNDLCP